VLVATSPSHIPGPPDPPHVDRCLRLSAHIPNYAVSAGDLWGEHARDTSDLDNVFALHRMLRAFAPDIVFLWNLHGIGGLHLIDFLNVHGAPWAIYLGDRVFEQLVNGAQAHVNSIFRGGEPEYFASGGVMAVSQHLVDEITRLGKFSFPRAPTIVHGYALTSGPYVRAAYRRGGRTRFLAAGRVAEHKGIGLICDAISLLDKAGVGNFEVDIFGDGDVAFYVNYANALAISRRITFNRAIPKQQLAEQYRSHDAFLFPTWSREPFAFAPIEAAAYGCVPIVTSDCGCAERIVDKVHGIKIERTAEALAEAMRGVIEGTIELERIGAAAAAMVRTDLTFAGHVDKIVAMLAEQCRTWDRSSLDDPRALLLPFVKHHLSLAFRAGATSD
jgi:glycosyltransferase involved in cell wall biosynthesis